MNAHGSPIQSIAIEIQVTISGITVPITIHKGHERQSAEGLVEVVWVFARKQLLDASIFVQQLTKDPMEFLVLGITVVGVLAVDGSGTRRSG
jgi:hypothetical protein